MNEIIVVTGQRGKGKTTYIKEAIDHFDRVLVFDLMGEFTYLETVTSLHDLAKSLTRYRKEPFFTLNYFSPKSSEIDFRICCKMIGKIRDLMFVIDELDYFTTAQKSVEEFDELIKRGRHQGISILCSSRRPHELPRLVTSQVSRFVTFRHLEPRDLDYIRNLTSIEEDRIKELPDFHYLEWNSGSVKEGEVKKPKKKKESFDFFKFQYLD
jgi:predicted DNA-binding protein